MKRKPKIRHLSDRADVGALFQWEDRKAIRHATHKERNALRSTWAKIFRAEEQATDRYLEGLRAAMRNQLEQAWLNQKLAEAEQRGRELARELNHHICRNERERLLKRGVVRGARSKTAM